MKANRNLSARKEIGIFKVRYALYLDLIKNRLKKRSLINKEKKLR